NNPVWNIDEKGLKKTTYNVIIDERSGNALVHTTTAPGLMCVRNTDMYGNRSYNWYDYTETNVTTVGLDGKISASSSTSRGAFRTNTLIKSGLYAGLKVDDYAVK